ncbi:MAG TPA: response regulator [Burkholderiales bacterium]
MARILVVDDDECLRELLNLHLWHAGYDVRLAEDAVEAGRIVLEAAPDLMIVDVNLPYMNGFEFVGAVRTDRMIPFFPVIFLTAQKSAVIRAREFGAVCLLKPVQADRLLAAVTSNMPNQRPRSRAAQPEFSPAG